MCKHYFLLLLAFLPLIAYAQKDKTAQVVLDKTRTTLQNGACVRISFDGTTTGTLLIKEKQYALSTETIASYYDGKTLWTLLKEDEEVYISTPSESELIATNPYVLLASYADNYSYMYKGNTTYKGEPCFEVLLKPLQKGEVKEATFVTSTSYVPRYIKIILTNGQVIETHITAYEPHQQVSEDAFKYNKAKHPAVEIIDLR